MSEIISFEPIDNGNDVVVIGDEKASQQISFQLAQDFYNEITGKSETQSDKYSDSFIYNLSDIEQLHYRINQSTEQYNICSANVIYSVKYTDDSSERFSSLERLKLHAPAKGQAVEELSIVYNILIVLPKVNRPQEYKIKITLVSRVAKIEKMRAELSSFPFQVPLHQFEKATTLRYSIDFVDISVANALASCIKSWSDSLTKTEPNTILQWFRDKSDFLPIISKYSLLSVSSYYIWCLSSKYVPVEDYVLRTIVLFVLASILFSFVSYKLGSYLGSIAGSNIDNTYEKSYICISNSDTNLVTKATKNISKSLRKSVISIVVTVVLGVASSLIANSIG
ncbi:hypothetical protein FXE82_16745 [Vibrio cholerae]|uniref:hypothetical protein n=1 Tax=Vibrio cholerae TaxID=666 RepID=UPI0011D55D00|nr:hypothetical protein [Vibrio cholerae]EKF9881373.1 hypothetical protein [Vibrio cholerae]MCX9453314.1 hypothetical protein [Vibrio cholerae]TXY37258.1 hypothetical protein FXE82_16745 [Vibrio cholerae]GIB78954.1 hypothetical protein VCSRO94_3572 [Vibrio cholerae]HDL9439111.1 hypothetical protein [Vibrio cholerae]